MMKIKIQESEKQGSGSEKGRKGDNYFNNIVKELLIEDTAAYKEIMRISYANFQRILSYIEEDINNKIERMLKRMLKSFAWAFTSLVTHYCQSLSRQVFVT